MGFIISSLWDSTFTPWVSQFQLGAIFKISFNACIFIFFHQTFEFFLLHPKYKNGDIGQLQNYQKTSKISFKKKSLME
jgi:hypothetical protein